MKLQRRHVRRGRELSVVRRVEGMQAAGLLRGVGLHGVAVSIERDVARRGRLGR